MPAYLSNRQKLLENLKDVETVAVALGIPYFDIYIMGGAAVILGGYSNRLTRDFDIVDIDYPSQIGRALRNLETYDMLDYSETPLSPSFRNRCRRLDQYQSIGVYIFSPEDIVVSKIIRLSEKDIEDINILIPDCDIFKINTIIDEVVQRKDLSLPKRSEFLRKIEIFRSTFNV